MEHDVILEEITREFYAQYTRITPKSKELHERAKKTLPGGVTYHIRYLRPYPPFIRRANGTRVIDVDGNTYDDYWMGHGTHLLGHSPKVVVDAVADAISQGTHFGYEHEAAVEYSELLARLVPGIEMVRFTNSGTEANMYTVRLVRAYTKRKYIVKIEGGWHGGYDALHVGVTPPFKGPESSGLPEEAIQYTVSVPFNDVHALERTLKEVRPAAVFIEPVLGAGGCIPPEKGYLREVRRLTYEHDVLMVMDEVITGFRMAPGGGQEYYGVTPDLVILGKAVAGGMPGAGAFGGRSDVMELLDHLAIMDPRKRSFHGGTFSGNPVSIAAGKALVSYLAENREIYDQANGAWEYLRRRLDSLCDEHDRLCWVTGDATLTGIHFTRKKPVNAAEAYDRWSRRVEGLANIFFRINGILYVSDHMMHLLPSLVHSNDQMGSLEDTFSELVSLIYRRLGSKPWRGRGRG